MPSEITNAALKELLEKWPHDFVVVYRPDTNSTTAKTQKDEHFAERCRRCQLEAAFPRIAALERLDEAKQCCGFRKDEDVYVVDGTWLRERIAALEAGAKGADHE